MIQQAIVKINEENGNADLAETAKACCSAIISGIGGQP